MRTKKIMIYLIAGLLILVSGCKKKEEKSQTAASCYELAVAMAATDADADNLTVCNMGNEEFKVMVAIAYELAAPDDGCIIYSMNEKPTEYVVFRAKENNDYINVDEIEIAFEWYTKVNIAGYIGYYPEAADMVENAIIKVYGEYVVLCISSNPNEAMEAFDRMYSLSDDELRKQMEEYNDIELILEENRKNLMADEDITETDNSKTDVSDIETNGDREELLEDVDDSIYFNADIVTAYINETPEILSNDKDKEIFTKASDVIDKCITDDMTQIEKEKAIHDYMCKNMSYDLQALANFGAPAEDSDNSYGMLVNGYGICTGYASTFKLLMNCLGIECMVVEGMVYDYTDVHAWNKVKLGATWYNVDVTWDDPTSSTDSFDESGSNEWIPTYVFFNCSDDVLSDNSHLWNHSLYPESLENME